MLRQTLIEAGIDDGRIAVVVDEQDAVPHALSMAAPGDLVLVLGDDIRRCWKQIIYFETGADKAAVDAGDNRRPVALDLPDLELGDDFELVRDERGVRLARELND